MIFLSPRIFANSFYNNKDIIFLSFFIFSIYFAFRLIDKPSNKNIILSALFCALAIDIRLVAVILPAVLLLVFFLSQKAKGACYKGISPNDSSQTKSKS